MLGILAIDCLYADHNRHIPIDTTEGTWLSLDVSPDGKQILFDLLGDIYTIPASGAEAKRLTTLPKPVPGRAGSPDDVEENGQAFDSQPQISPDGRSIVFISDRDGADNVYVMNVDGSGVRRVTTGNDRMNSPAWSPTANTLRSGASRSHRRERRHPGAPGSTIRRADPVIT